ncbi:MAG: hypothetical protein LH485_06545 [Sphingomonas bacterium]|nr:hypothetical protein [Sphingomonas bacterium]
MSITEQASVAFQLAGGAPLTGTAATVLRSPSDCEPVVPPHPVMIRAPKHKTNAELFFMMVDPCRDSVLKQSSDALCKVD